MEAHQLLGDGSNSFDLDSDGKEYHRIWDDDNDALNLTSLRFCSNCNGPARTSPHERASNAAWKLLFLISLILNVCFAIVLGVWLGRSRSRLPPWPVDVYSPVDEVISYETKVFDDDFANRTVYASTDAAADAAWASLYEGLLYLNIPTSVAKFLPNATSPHPRAPELSLVGIDVFHQLHCLDKVRKSLYPNIYNETAEEGWMLHMGHCLDSIRQSLMCSADVSTIFFQWYPEKGYTLPDAQVTHTCRNWEKVKGWAKEHELKVTFDPREKAEKAPIGGKETR